MNYLQSDIIQIATDLANAFGIATSFDGPQWSSEFRSEYWIIEFGQKAVEGAVFPMDANFWNANGLDIRFERASFASDEDMLKAIKTELTRALENHGVTA